MSEPFIFMSVSVSCLELISVWLVLFCRLFIGEFFFGEDQAPPNFTREPLKITILLLVELFSEIIFKWYNFQTFY